MAHPTNQSSSAGEILAQSLSQLERNIHPVVIISAYNKAFQAALLIIQRISIPIDTENDDESSLSSRSPPAPSSPLAGPYSCSSLPSRLSEQSPLKKTAILPSALNGTPESRIFLEGRWSRAQRLNDVMLNKDITHPSMRHRIENPRIALLGCPLEYKKGESQTNMEFSKETDWERAEH